MNKKTTTREKIAQHVKSAICDYCCKDLQPGELKDDMKLIEDCGMGNLDILMMCGDLEDPKHYLFSESDHWKIVNGTVKTLIDVVCKHQGIR